MTESLLEALGVTITPLSDDSEARACAGIMATSEPWITLGRGYDEWLAKLRDPPGEVLVARAVLHVIRDP